MLRLAVPFTFLLLSSCVFSVGSKDKVHVQHDRRPRFLNQEGRADDNPFSHAVLTGDTLYVAGSLGLDPATGQPPESVEEEVRLMMDSIGKKLDLADMTFSDVVQVQVFCPDLTLYDRFNLVYRSYFPGRYPARAFIGSGPLLRGARFEMNAIAVRR